MTRHERLSDDESGLCSGSVDSDWLLQDVLLQQPWDAGSSGSPSGFSVVVQHVVLVVVDTQHTSVFASG
ncbi:hypothetical protein VHA_003001 [Grimontia hollisae CIP 101886]|uniref:Uncharacterized protein n=1 Tax=Grimontia hollisae CIP 101886 TaxID=675812 RepID=D0IB74_GRIHO|nr:hypothetical protein VHA_003001 [Grimontia hollisae CIP 101886]